MCPLLSIAEVQPPVLSFHIYVCSYLWCGEKMICCAQGQVVKVSPLYRKQDDSSVRLCVRIADGTGVLDLTLWCMLSEAH